MSRTIPVAPAGGLTTEERDAINLAKSRLRGCVALLALVDEHPDDESMVDGEPINAMGVLIDDMRDAVNVLYDTFEGADAREKGGAR
ncbi:MAG: hypothetical protein ABJA98_22135 [Acidobacteriota bacterium]